MTFALPDKSVSQAISIDWSAVALGTNISLRRKSKQQSAHHAPTGTLIGPLEDSRSRLTQPAVVLMNLQKQLGNNRDRKPKNLRFLQNVVLNLLLFTAVLKHPL
jgi:hypothetical protein